MKESISVLIVAHDAQDTLERCVFSILGQSFQPEEIWILDDGSKDDTLKIALNLAESHAQIHLMAQKHHGEAFSRNRLLDEAKGQWIMMMDGSEILKEHAIKTLITNAKEKNVLLCCERESFSLMNRTLSAHALMKCLLRHSDLNRVSGKLFHRRLFELLRFEVGKEVSEAGIMAQLFELAVRVGFAQRTVMKKTRKLKRTEQDYFDAMERQCSVIMHRYPALSKECACVILRIESEIMFKQRLNHVKEILKNTEFKKILKLNL